MVDPEDHPCPLIGMEMTVKFSGVENATAKHAQHMLPFNRLHVCEKREKGDTTVNKMHSHSHSNLHTMEEIWRHISCILCSKQSIRFTWDKPEISSRWKSLTLPWAADVKRIAINWRGREPTDLRTTYVFDWISYGSHILWTDIYANAV